MPSDAVESNIINNTVPQAVLWIRIYLDPDPYYLEKISKKF